MLADKFGFVNSI